MVFNWIKGFLEVVGDFQERKRCYKGNKEVSGGFFQYQLYFDILIYIFIGRKSYGDEVIYLWNFKQVGN